MSYSAIVCRIKTRPHPNADRLQLGNCHGFQVVTGKDTEHDQLGVFFPSDGALSHEFCYENSEYRENKGENKNPEKFGYFGEKRRVRTIRLRGEKSEGYWVPLATLEWTGTDLSELNEGDTFCTLNGKLICEKYYSQATRRALKSGGSAGGGKKFQDITMFKKHFDTEKLRYHIGRIPFGARLILTEKLHGTSGRTGHVLIPKELTRFQRWWNIHMSWTGLTYPTEEWKHVSGTRRVVLDPTVSADEGYYSGTTFRHQVHQMFSLAKGETIYYEIVGYDGWRGDGEEKYTRPIMGTHHLTGDKGDAVRKSLAKKYGNDMVFSYGCEPGGFKIYVYRITQTNIDGVSTDLSWEQVKARCVQLGLEYVPELDKFRHTTGEATLDLCEQHTRDQHSHIDHRHIIEGVAVRVEDENMFDTFKYKGFDFCHLEGIKKNDDTWVDLEEIS